MLIHLGLLAWLGKNDLYVQPVAAQPAITLIKLVKPVIAIPATAAPHVAAPSTAHSSMPSAEKSSAQQQMDNDTTNIPAAALAPPPPELSAHAQAEPAGLTLPPSVLLKLTVRTTLGTLDGELEWLVENGGYNLRLETLLRPDSLSALKLIRRSTGGFDSSGLAPRRYTEQRGGRAEVATNFLRTREELGGLTEPLVTFSRVTDRIPLAAGVQDELSVLMQLGFLVRGNPELLQQPGSTFEVPVAGTKGVEFFNFTLIGQETVRSDLGAVATWHLRSQPLQDRYGTRIEVWLAPEHDFLPVKSRFDFGFAFIELLAEKISPLASAAKHAP
ncbi:MAG: DUF3108 domain-containing protein [Burkholderiaceae bacterium]|nr:MAG: DUF3108 domain-containing protein [Burkholderiaceae bacterium]